MLISLSNIKCSKNIIDDYLTVIIDDVLIYAKIKCLISKGYDPKNYSILVENNICNVVYTGDINSDFKIGDKIHRKNINGIYTILDFNSNFIKITANSWNGDFKIININEYKCHSNHLLHKYRNSIKYDKNLWNFYNGIF